MATESMPRNNARFVSKKIIFDILDVIEGAGDIDSKAVPESIRSEFGAGVRKLAANSFDLVYTYDAERDIVFIEATIRQRTAW